MQAEDVKSLLQEKLPGTQVEVEGEGCNFQLNLTNWPARARSSVSSRSTPI